MKSYENHLTDTKSFGEALRANYRPTMRSSAVFPLILRRDGLESIYTFMGYWLRKRNISVITALFTVRDSNGKKIAVRSYEITSANSYAVYGSELISFNADAFEGSVEIEIFSAVDMVFPYPAITFALKGRDGLTFVHTCGRIFNDFDDLESNNETLVPETGFDLLIGEQYTPFFSFVNGPIAIETARYELEFIDCDGKKIIQQRVVENIQPYGLAWIEIFDSEVTKDLFKGEKITVKIRHGFKGFFPRFVAGNIHNDYSDVSLTHSYYDTSVDTSTSSTYANPSCDLYYDSVIAIPFDTEFQEVELAIYPNFTTAPCDLFFELFDAQGNIIEAVGTKITVADGTDTLAYIPMMKRFDKHRENVSEGMVRVIVDGKGKVPTRMKFGLNFANPHSETNLPSNICFNAAVPNTNILKKPGTFRWCTVFSGENQKIFLHNTSFVKSGGAGATVDVELCREQDDEIMKWSVTLPYNGTAEVIKEKSADIERFLNGSIGWASFQCSVPFITGYYVTDYKKGVVGADHLY